MLDAFKLTAILISGILWGAWLVLVLRKKNVHPIRETLEGFSRLGWMKKVGVLFIVVQLTMFGGAKHGGTNDVDDVTGTNDVELVEGGTNTNEELRVESGELMMGQTLMSSTLHSSFLTLNSDSAAPYRLESVSTNSDISYTLPADGAIRGTWHLTGAYEDVQKVTLDGFAFPLGSDLCTSLWAYTWGKVRPQLRNASNEIAAVGAPMSAIPDVSRFWTLATTNDTYLLTWESFAVGRVRGEAASSPLQDGIVPPFTSGEDAASPFLSAQIELFRNGDFITRSNEVECVYRRVIEPNPIDYPINPPDPDDPSKPLYPYGPVQDLSVIEETNAYCWVDIVVNTADAWVRFEGDGASNLTDPSFAAKAGETNHVVILIGKTYKVTCDMPFTVIDKSDPAIDEWWEDGNTLWLNWPVQIEAWDGNGDSFMMHVVPNCLGGEFSWTNSCCAVSGGGLHFSYGCDGFCLCGGCSARGYYGYEGYRIGCSGGSCGCSWYDDDDRHGEDDPDDPEPMPSISVGFDDDAVIYEDAYTNTPGNVEPWRSTTTKLHLEVHGGMKGGTAEFTFTNQEKLLGPDIPESINVPAGHCKKYEFTYRGQLPSGSTNDIVVTGTFTENDPEGEGDAATYTDEASTTSVKVELTAEYDAPENHNPSRHIYGVGEQVNFRISPQTSAITLKTERLDTGDQGDYYELFDGAEECDAGATRTYICPVSASYHPPIRIKLGDVEYSPSISIVEPQMVVTPEATCTDTFLPFQVGSGRLKTTNYIGPMTVSFRGVRFVEVPCTDVIPATGYFASSNYNSNVVHDENAQAGWIHDIQAGNYWTIDEAGRSGVYPNWFAGMMEWKIPVGWVRKRVLDNDFAIAHHADYERDGDPSSRRLLIGNRDDKYKQVFVIYSDGGCAIEKYGYRLYRDRMWIVGVVAQILEAL